jgi:hypothetical protein
VDQAVRRSFEKADPSRLALGHAGSAPEVRDLARAARYIPRLARFVPTVDDRQAEQLRRLKYRPSGGFCLTTAGAGPGAYRPVAVIADPLPATVAPGEPLALDVHVVNDLRRAIERATVVARLSWPGGGHEWRWQGDVDADSCALVGTVQALAPSAPGPLALELHLAGVGVDAANAYHSTVSSP